MDYFRWRSEDAYCNALNSHCYWKLREEGEDAVTATKRLSGLSVVAKNEFLFQHGINFNDLPAWQKRGIGIYWEEYAKEGWNPKMQLSVVARRLKLKTNYEMPIGEEYRRFINVLFRNNSEGMGD